MLTMNATDVRKNWSEVSDSVVRVKPQFIKRTRDYMMLSNIEFMEELLYGYKYLATEFREKDNSVTLSLDELDIVENAPTQKEAKRLLANSILEYATEFYEEFKMWSSAPNRKKHIPYVFKALIMDDVQKIEECIICRAGET